MAGGPTYVAWTRRSPGDALVGHLVDDLEVLVVELGHALHTIHELGEVLELCPLVVDGCYGRSISIDFSVVDI